MTFGITETGFNLKRLSDIKTEIKNDLLAIFPNLTLSDETVLGQVISIFADKHASIWELFEDIYNAADPNSAEGYALKLIAAIINMKPLASTYSTSTVTITGSPGKVVSAGFLIGVQGTDNLFETDEDVTIPGGGTIDVTVTATEKGAIVGNAGYINTIINPDPDITSVTNALDASVGREEETDIELRERRLTKLTSSRSGTNGAIRAAILDLNDTETDAGQVIQTCKVISNRTKVTSASGQPASSFQAFVYTSDSLSATKKTEIANAILDSMPPGIEPYGAITESVTDEQGVAQDISFSTPDLINIYVTFTLDNL